MRHCIKSKIAFILFAVLVTGVMTQVYSHCQIPCGIYDDPARLKMIGEHITTIEKSMKQIAELSDTDPTNYNQIVRWVNNKENHADELNSIITDYFLAQRIKPTGEDSANYKTYVRQLTLLHEMLVTTMKCKQTIDLVNISKLKSLLIDFESESIKD